MFKICKNKNVLFNREQAKSWTYLTTNQFGLEKKTCKCTEILALIITVLYSRRVPCKKKFYYYDYY